MTAIKTIHNALRKPVSIAPLAVFRIAFGFIMFFSAIRFVAKGWVRDLYIEPQFFFSYRGMEWIQPFSGPLMYALFGLIAVSALLVMIGLYYRPAIITYFLAFTYVELIDKTNYLNHYYFVSLVSFLLIWVPAHRYFSLDAWRKPALSTKTIPAWTLLALKLQLAIVYFYAGVAKINADWLLHALPLKIWLPPHADLPLIGPLLTLTATAYVFSWFGALYDLSVPFLLWNRKTTKIAYVFVIVFHLATWILFPIGMFPFIMILCTSIFFPPAFHQKIIALISSALNKLKLRLKPKLNSKQIKPVFAGKFVLYLMTAHFILQILLPLRHTLYPGNLKWTEEGYRFSWRVMLMEKAGYAIFHIKDGKTGKTSEAYASDYLTPFQEKMMSTQPDMILQFAHFLKSEFEKKGYQNPKVYAESYASLNGAGSRLFIDPAIDLTQKHIGWKHIDWVIPYDSKNFITEK